MFDLYGIGCLLKSDYVKRTNYHSIPVADYHKESSLPPAPSCEGTSVDEPSPAYVSWLSRWLGVSLLIIITLKLGFQDPLAPENFLNVGFIYRFNYKY